MDGILAPGDPGYSNNLDPYRARPAHRRDQARSAANGQLAATPTPDRPTHDRGIIDKNVPGGPSVGQQGTRGPEDVGAKASSGVWLGPTVDLQGGRAACRHGIPSPVDIRLAVQSAR